MTTKAKLGKRLIKADQELMPPPTLALVHNEDAASMDNNTNFNWGRKDRRGEEKDRSEYTVFKQEKITVEGSGVEIDAPQFYEQSFYFV